MVILVPRRPRVLALAWLAVALLLAATSGCLCRRVPAAGVPSSDLLSTPSGSSPPTTPPSPDTTAPPPPFHFPRPICRRCPPRCPPEGCPGTGGGSP
ncbi:unnamed protein product [Urochloa decumbens]|uniref:Uncharacterized protein n=1 Tax=Urochloa decumbens TaxID=240449 RepID=A0ABC8VEC9_9POAL